MFKSFPYIEIGFMSSIFGIISEYFGSIKIAYMILITLIIIDTITGILSAIKYNRISSSGIAKLARKVTLYSLTVFTARLLEIAILELYDTTIISQMTIAYLVITEVISIFENLTLLGVPLPNHFLESMLRQIKLPGLDKLFSQSRERLNKSIGEIEDIITYQIPAIDNKEKKKILAITTEVWKDVAIEIVHFIQRNNDNKDLLYVKVSSLYQNGIQRIDEKLDEENLSMKELNNFNQKNKHILDAFLWKSKQICFSDDKISLKKEKLLEEIITYLYTLIIKTQKSKI